LKVDFLDFLDLDLRHRNNKNQKFTFNLKDQFLTCKSIYSEFPPPFPNSLTTVQGDRSWHGIGNSILLPLCNQFPKFDASEKANFW